MPFKKYRLVIDLNRHIVWNIKDDFIHEEKGVRNLGYTDISDGDLEEKVRHILTLVNKRSME